MLRETETVEAASPIEASFQPVMGVYFLTAAMAVTINLAMRKLALPAIVEIAIGVTPLLMLVALGRAYLKFLGTVDEMVQLIHTRAAAMTALVLLGYLVLANAALPDRRIGPEDLNVIWMTIWCFYLLALKVMRKKFE